MGRRLAEKLARTYPNEIQSSEGLDADVVEAACLAHDLGHPPFGHIAEEELNKLTSDIGGFEGNAQSFRVLTKLAFHSENHRGLDLTRATLGAVLKYPWKRGENPAKPKKWGAYESEKPDFDFALALAPSSQARTIEAELMDWADDVTYSVHDIEDFYRAGRMPVHLLAKADDATERDAFFENVFEERRKDDRAFAKRADLQEAFTSVIISNFPLSESYVGTARQRAALRLFSGNLIERYIGAVKFVIENSRCQVVIDANLKDEVAMFKELVWTYVIEAPALASQQYGQRHIIRSLFQIFSEAAANREEQRIFPAFYRERLQEAGDDPIEKKRICIDLIAGLTENQAGNIYRRLNGSALGSALDDMWA